MFNGFRKNHKELNVAELSPKIAEKPKPLASLERRSTECRNVRQMVTLGYFQYFEKIEAIVSRNGACLVCGPDFITS